MGKFRDHFRRLTRGSRAPYQYGALREEAREIRLLTLVPGSFSEEVEILLHTTRLDHSNVPQYEALSYVWGSDKSKAEVVVDPVERQGISITRNLAIALPYLRLRDRARVLWIDTICVNQADKEERSKQVERMADVFKLATRVVIWLGPAVDGSDHALNLLGSLATKVSFDGVTQVLRPSASSNGEVHWADYNVELPWNASDFRCIVQLLERPWFERLWTQQEAQLANSETIVQCGKTGLLLDDFRKAILCVACKPMLDYVPTKDLDRIRLIQRTTTPLPRDPLRRLLDEITLYKASDPRDRVFALLGMLDHHFGHHFGIIPNYENTQWQVYKDAFFAFGFNGVLDILTTCEMSYLDDTHPTWVPDWSAEKRTVGLHQMVLASGTRHPEMIYTSNRPDVLNVVGTSCASITQVMDFPLREEWLEGITMGVRRIAGELLGNLDGALRTENEFETRWACQGSRVWNSFSIRDDAYVGGGTLFEAFCKTLCCNHFRESTEPPVDPSPSLAEGLATLLQVLDHSGGVYTFDGPEVVNRFGGVRYWSGVDEWTKGRTFFTTPQGYIGIGPPCAQAGDIIAVVLGCCSPMVLRPAGVHFRVVGECYVCGLLAGEAFLGSIPAQYRPGLYLDEEAGKWHYGFRNTATGQSSEKDPRVREQTVILENLPTTQLDIVQTPLPAEPQSICPASIIYEQGEFKVCQDVYTEGAFPNDRGETIEKRSWGCRANIGGPMLSRFGGVTREYLLFDEVDESNEIDLEFVDRAWSTRALIKRGVNIEWFPLV